jgi:MFS transporter, DHA1 family, multidrug resistance protein
MTIHERVDAERARATPEPNPTLKISFVEFVGLNAALMALTALSIDIMLPALPEIARALGVANENDRQLIIILYMAGFSFGQLFVGPLSDRFGRKPVLMAGLVLYIVGTLGALAARSFDVLLCARVLQGIGAASPRVVSVAVIRDIYAGRQMARVMSFTMMVFIIIPVLAPSVGQALIHVGNWHLMFYALLAMATLTAVWAMARLPETSKHALGQESAWTLQHSLSAALLNSQTMAYGASSGFMFGCLLSYVASAQQVFVEVFGMEQLFPIIFGAIASSLAVASFINAGLVGRLGMRRVSHTALIAFVGVSLALFAAAYAGIAGIFVFAPLVAVAFFLFGLIAPNFNAIAMEPQGHNAGMASSIIGSLSTAIGALAGGAVARFFDGTVVPIAAGFALCSLITVGIVTWQEGRAGLFGRNRPA